MYLQTINAKVVKMVSFVMSIFYYNKKSWKNHAGEIKTFSTIPNHPKCSCPLSPVTIRNTAIETTLVLLPHENLLFKGTLINCNLAQSQ